VEWADRIESLWPEEHLRIDLSYGDGENDRRVTIEGTPRYAPLLEELSHADFGA
jgi:tRNA A37 threonylcarbamoyladenosine biosynthesis protein TsaE